MKDFVPSYDKEKLQYVLEIKEAFNRGEFSLEEGQRRLRERVTSLKPYEIALAEQELKEFEDDECRKEDIQSMLALFDGLLDRSRPELPDHHPISCYYRENEALKKICLEIEDLVQYPLIKNQWLELYDRLDAWKLHLSRKQNQLYSILEQKGFDRPTTTMWTLDNFIRDEIRDARKLLEEDREDDFIAMQGTIVADLRDLMEKEETVLYPTSMAMISPEEFMDMMEGDQEIGFAWIEVHHEEEKASPETEKTSGLEEELAALLAKHGFAASSEQKELDVAQGKLTLEQINLIYKHMPVDISYVDEKEIVKFYTDTAHRVFPRSKNVIGRDVKNCHPRGSVHIVEEIIDKFRRGEEDTVEFWINKPDLFIYIYYVAVRDEQGNFRGVIEMMQDCTHIRRLQGSRTLLNWEKSERGDGEKEDEKTPTPSTEKERDPSMQETKPTIEEREDGLVFHPDTKLKDILEAHPWLKEEMEDIHPNFRMLKTPLARVMIPVATIHMMSERTGMPEDELIEKIKEKIKNH
ncbi:MAG: PAS domain-containing protein [Tissierellia bacterium]|nr:PAS domain-containing protein [Tissierellia bacterium]